jgi:hypothetical protein
MWYITLKGHWCDIVLNAHAPVEDKGNDREDGFYEELEQVPYENFARRFQCKGREGGHF